MKLYEILKGAQVVPSEHELEDVARRSALVSSNRDRSIPVGYRKGDVGRIVGADPAARMKVLIDWGGGVVKSHRVASVSRVY